jgi:hypothetical protein
VKKIVRSQALYLILFMTNIDGFVKSRFSTSGKLIYSDESFYD